MSNHNPIEYKGQRVLLTAQLAESYGTDSERISKNYHDNKGRFTEGKHFMKVEGEALRQFKDDFRNSELVGKNASVLYLWTKKGSLLHAKSLGTDEAWDAYEMLVDDYFDRFTSLQAPMSQSELVAYLAQQNVERERAEAEHNRRLAKVEQKMENTAEILALNPADWRKNTTALLNKIAQAMGGGQEAFQAVRNESYELLELRGSCRLGVRQKGIQKRMALEGASKSKIQAVSKLDVIDEDRQLIEIYIAIVKEMAIKHNILTEE